MCVVQAGNVSLSVCTLTVFCGNVPSCSSSELPGLSATYRRAGLVLTARFPLTLTPDRAGYDLF